ncbi:hypothetical protein L6452_31099 [Arctium lappa]|uniref:Uncharacterized protein n=1 Tax=Arctium lappa TaxID=4217 RepID=A0ACB8ZPC7_ARCLA|nr:hypothetical protein L6452_31099 [Arctium lappa]
MLEPIAGFPATIERRRKPPLNTEIRDREDGGATTRYLPTRKRLWCPDRQGAPEETVPRRQEGLHFPVCRCCGFLGCLR